MTSQVSASAEPNTVTVLRLLAHNLVGKYIVTQSFRETFCAFISGCEDYPLVESPAQTTLLQNLDTVVMKLSEDESVPRHLRTAAACYCYHDVSNDMEFKLAWLCANYLETQNASYEYAALCIDFMKSFTVFVRSNRQSREDMYFKLREQYEILYRGNTRVPDFSCVNFPLYQSRSYYIFLQKCLQNMPSC